jgi:2-iminoacetate synthase
VSFSTVLPRIPLDRLLARADGTTPSQVERALSKEIRTLEDFAALISPTAAARLDDLVAAAGGLTLRRFGRTMQLYAPLYLSNACVNTCLYCGFSRPNAIARRTLAPAELEREMTHVASEGFRHLLLVSGEDPRDVGLGYLEAAVRAARRRFASVSIEVAPLEMEGYRRMLAAGAEGVVAYQEVYDRGAYEAVHTAGPKKAWAGRLEVPERVAAAGMRRLGIGALLGLSPWRREALALAAHALHLQKTAWRAVLTVSFPRLRPAAGGFVPPHPVDDTALVQMIAALRLLLPDAGLVLSTREPKALRDRLALAGITTMSAGSRTEPGGYEEPGKAEGQFEVHDARSPAEGAARLRELGLDPVWKDWDAALV